MTRTTAVRAAVIAAAGWLVAASAAHAQNVPLSVVEVGAPAVNCVFNNANAPNCQVVVDDSVQTFMLPNDSGNARLQSRTYPGAASAPAAGDMAYVYRVDLTSVQGKNCVFSITIVSGNVVPLPYATPKNNVKSDVFVVTSGGLGSVGIGSAVQNGAEIFFTFSKPLCPGATSYFFGFASTSLKPVAGTASIGNNNGGGPENVADRVP